jgi:DNA-binding LacI/PurR family transcriptional regulator
MIFNTREDEANELRCVDLLLGRQCDGLLLIKAPSGPMHEQCRERLARFPMPIVYLDRRPDAERDAVLVDNETGACRAVEHLLRLGHRKIAIVTMGREVSTHASRFEGYRRALADFGVAVRDDYVQRVPATFSDAYSATLQLLGLEDPPSALFATNGRLTTGAMSAIQSRKLRCPEDVSVIGFDAFEWQTVFRPRLTVVDQPAHVMGRKAAELLVERVTGLYEGPARRIVLNTELIVRESCGVYRGHPSNATHGQ